MAVKSFLESNVSDSNLLSRIEKFKSSLPENQREKFTDLITLTFLEGQENGSKVWRDAWLSYTENSVIGDR